MNPKKTGELLTVCFLLVTLSLTSHSDIARISLAQSAEYDSDQQLVNELKSLAQSDADNDVERRTEFIIQLYGQNSIGLTAQEIRKIYDDAFNAQTQKNKRSENIKLVAGITTGLLVLGIVALIVAKRKILKVKKISANIPFGIGQVELETVETSRNAAWSLYVEMTTRIATQQLEDSQGLLREALNSLYALFGITRQILKDAGPDVGASPESVGGIATAVLNQGLRPFMSKWHPKLQMWEAQRPENVSPKEHEQNWLEEAQMRNELKRLGQNLEQYTNALAKIAGAPSLNSRMPPE